MGENKFFKCPKCSKLLQIYIEIPKNTKSWPFIMQYKHINPNNIECNIAFEVYYNYKIGRIGEIGKEGFKELVTLPRLPLNPTIKPLTVPLSNPPSDPTIEPPAVPLLKPLPILSMEPLVVPSVSKSNILKIIKNSKDNYLYIDDIIRDNIKNTTKENLIEFIIELKSPEILLINNEEAIIGQKFFIENFKSMKRPNQLTIKYTQIQQCFNFSGLDTIDILKDYKNKKLIKGKLLEKEYEWYSFNFEKFIRILFLILGFSFSPGLLIWSITHDLTYLIFSIIITFTLAVIIAIIIYVISKRFNKNRI